MGLSAHLVPPEDPEALARAIIDAIDHPGAVDTVDIPAFVDIARMHLQVFEQAMQRRTRR
jgi:hypothetical protein